MMRSMSAVVTIFLSFRVLSIVVMIFWIKSLAKPEGMPRALASRFRDCFSFSES